MIYEMRTYQLKVGTVQKYLKQFEEKGLPIVSKYCTLVGYWTVESGPAQSRRSHLVLQGPWTIGEKPARNGGRTRIGPRVMCRSRCRMVESQESTILAAAAFSPLQ